MDEERYCKAAVCKAETLVECSNYDVVPSGIHGPVVGKIPVVIAEPVIQVDVEADIELEEPVIEIKRIKKNVFITQCKLIDTGHSKSGKLFLGGYIRKNIEYATADCTCGKNKAVSGDIRHTTVNVPFRCVTSVNYVSAPQINYQEVVKESATFSEIKGCGSCGDTLIGRYPCEQNFQHHECFNERVYCELEEVRIYEDDIHKEPKLLDHELPAERTFKWITEKMVVYIRLKLLQLQQVNIPGGPKPHDGKGKFIK